MMRIILSFIFVFLGFCIQMTLLPSFFIKGDLVFVLVAYFCLVYGWKVGLILAIYGGILLDSFSLSANNIICLGLMSVFAGFLRDAIFTESIFTKLFSFIFINIFYFFISYMALRHNTYLTSGFVGTYFVPFFLYNFVIALFAFFILERFYAKV